MEKNKNVLEIVNITEPIVALEVLYQAVELAQKQGLYNMNDSNKIHQSLVCLLNHFKQNEPVSE